MTEKSRRSLRRQHAYRGLDAALDELFDFLDRNSLLSALPWASDQPFSCLERLLTEVPAARRLACGEGLELIPRIALHASYSLEHNSPALDLRLSRTFVFRDHWRFSLIAEGFNLYNAANLSGYSTDLTSPAFGDPEVLKDKVELPMLEEIREFFAEELSAAIAAFTG